MLLAAALLPGCDAPRDEQAAVPQIDQAQVEAALDAAERYMALGNTVEAKAIAIRLTKSAPMHFAPDDLLGRISVRRALDLRASGRDKEAALAFSIAHDYYKEAVRKAPDIPGLHQSAGEIAQLAGRVDAAMAHYKRAAVLSPDNPVSPLYIAQLLVAGQSPQDARPWINKVLALAPNQPHAMATLAVLEMELGNRSAAFEAINAARRALPADMGIRVIEARMHRRNDDPEHALELLLSLSEQQRADEGVTRELALNWATLDRHDRAAEAWTLCFASMPDVFRSGRIALQVAEAWIEDGQFDKATVWIEQAEMLGVPGEQVELVRSAARKSEESQD